MPFEVPTAPDRMLGKAMDQGDSKNSPAALIPALDRILARYPDYFLGYVMRLGSLCGGNDRAAILSNINSALKYVGTSWIGKGSAGKDSLGSLLSMRAKIEHANGDDGLAMEDLDKAIHANLADSTHKQRGHRAREKRIGVHVDSTGNGRTRASLSERLPRIPLPRALLRIFCAVE